MAKFCNKCGSPVTGVFCGKCGADTRAAASPASQPAAPPVPAALRPQKFPNARASFFGPSTGGTTSDQVLQQVWSTGRREILREVRR